MFVTGFLKRRKPGGLIDVTRYGYTEKLIHFMEEISMLFVQLVAYLSQTDRYDVCRSYIKKKITTWHIIIKKNFFAFLLISAV